MPNSSPVCSELTEHYVFCGLFSGHHDGTDFDSAVHGHVDVMKAAPKSEDLGVLRDNVPTVLLGMVHPVVRSPSRGIIWNRGQFVLHLI